MRRRHNLLKKRVPCPVCCGSVDISFMCERCNRTGCVDIEREVVAEIMYEDEALSPVTREKQRDLVTIASMFETLMSPANIIAWPSDEDGYRIRFVDAPPHDVEWH